MKTISGRRVASLLLILTLTSLNLNLNLYGQAGGPSAPANGRTVAEKLDDLAGTVKVEMTATNTPGAAVLIVHGDKVVYAGGFGTKSVEGGSPVTPDTLFRIGSTTKMFTAAALAALADQKKVRFVGKYEHAPQSWDVSLREGKLYVTTDDKEHELKPSGTNQFSYPGGGMLFVASTNGEFEHIFMGLYAARRTKR